MAKFYKFKFDCIFLYDPPEDLIHYFYIFDLLKENGKLFIFSNNNDYPSKKEFFNNLLKGSL